MATHRGLLTAVLVSGSAQAAKSVVITGNREGKCTPEMPMVMSKVPQTIELKSVGGKTILLESAVLNLRLKAIPGKGMSQVVTVPSKGNYNFTCGDAAVPANKRTQGMFMAM